MFSFLQVGVLELVSLFLVGCVASALVLVRPTSWRWWVALTLVFFVAMIITPADPASMWLLAAPTCALVLVARAINRPSQQRDVPQ